VVAEVMVGGMFFSAPRVAHPGADDAIEDPEPGLRAPKSAKTEGKGFHMARQGPVKGRHVFY
jgi:hypothetical protein